MSDQNIFEKNIEEILITEEQIKKRVKELAEQISNDYKDKEPLLVSILKGSFMFLSDLLRNLKIQCTVDFVAISSYNGSTESTGVVRQLLDLRENPVGKDILIVEDIVDTGFTLNYLKKNLLTRNPSSLKICVLLDKKERRKEPIEIDYTGFVIPDKFVVGYGLDYQEKYRNLPYIGVIKL
ncbi:MAG: hypoxanthine phosphoribosyltransferase [Endomicrobiia bacterium]